MFLDEVPWLWRRTLISAGALGPGVRTYWAWPDIADAPSIEVTGGDGALTIADTAGSSTVSRVVRVVVTARGLTCARCGHGCYALVFRDGWGCRRCSGCKYRIKYHPSPMFRRLSLMRKLARADPLSLKAYELQRKLNRVNRVLLKRARHVGERITSGRNR